jgi:hypothetical protein
MLIKQIIVSIVFSCDSDGLRNETNKCSIEMFINKARILCKLHICFYDAYRQNFGFSGRINKFLMKLRHFENAYFAYFKHLEHILGKNAY